MNNVVMYGSIGEPKFRDVNTKNGTREICSFGICQTEGKDTSGNTIFAWYNAEYWINKDSKLRPLLMKGTKVIVEGELRTERWKDREGTEKTSIKIACRNITLAGDRQAPAQQSSPAPAPVADDDGHDDLPF